MTDVPLFRRRSHTVLVIEDDSANRQLLASMLTRERYTVRTAADGESGLIAALDPDLDLILLDIGLPKIDGLEVTRRLRLDRRARTVPIIRHHHERWDGFGYPDRIAGDAIPHGARIVGLVDAFDAMTHDRPYRDALPLDVAIDEIRSGAGRQFDPVLASAFLGILEATTAKAN